MARRGGAEEEEERGKALVKHAITIVFINVQPARNELLSTLKAE